MSFISNIMGWILAQLSEIFSHNFAASVLVFTILVNVLMLPLTLKSQKSTAKQAKLKPKLDALKKKYGNDKQKYSMAMNDLYQKEGVSMSGGCLPMIIRLLIMWGVYYAVVSPLTYVLQLNTTAISAAKQWTAYVKVVETSTLDWDALGLEEMKINDAVISLAEKYDDAENIDTYAKLAIVNVIDKADAKTIENGSPERAVKDAISKNKVTREVEVVKYLTAENEDKTDKYPIVADVYGANNGEFDTLTDINFNLFGLDLTEKPEFSWNFAKFQPIWIIPLISFATSILSSVVTMKIQKKANPDAPSMLSMILVMSVFSLVIAFGVPGAVGFYWACSNVISGGIQAVIQLVYGPNVMVAKAQSKAVVARAKIEKQKIDRASSRANEGSEE